MSASIVSRIEVDWLFFLPNNIHTEFICLETAVSTDDHGGAKGA